MGSARSLATGAGLSYIFWSIRIIQQHIKMPKGSKKAKKSGSNIFALFSQKQIQDLKAAFAAIGRPVSDGEANNMVGEAPGPINFTQMVTLFAEKMAGGTDDDDVI